MQAPVNPYFQGVQPFLNPNVPQGLINNPLGATGVPVVNSSLCLNQIQGFEPVKQFTDDTNTTWNLIKSFSDSTVDIPSPKSMQIIDFWNHDFPGVDTKLYVYVVEGVRQPRVETEKPTRILYQWFSTVFLPTFTPQMITDKEWLKANVYAAPVSNGRISKLKALCHIQDDIAAQAPSQDDKLLTIEELNANSQSNNGANKGKGRQQHSDSTGVN